MALPPKSAAGKALVTITIAMLVMSWITVGVRIWVRRWIKGLGLDDWLMVVGLILFTVACQNILSAAYHGVGTPDRYLNEEIVREGRKWFWICSVVYPFAALAIKASICTCLLRFTKARRYRLPLYAIIALSCIASLVTSMTLLVWCLPSPVAANWDARAGKCPNPKILSNVSYYLSANSILTDWACAIIPAFVLWDVQLKLRIKVSLIMILALGVVASVATIVRLAYFTAYSSTVNYMHNIANIATWSMIECGTGIVAGSIATFRPLLRLVPFLSQTSSGGKSGAITGGTHSRSQHLDDLRGTRSSTLPFRDPNRTSGNNYLELSDAESQKHILKETKIELSTMNRQDG